MTDIAFETDRQPSATRAAMIEPFILPDLQAPPSRHNLQDTCSNNICISRQQLTWEPVGTFPDVFVHFRMCGWVQHGMMRAFAAAQAASRRAEARTSLDGAPRNRLWYGGFRSFATGANSIRQMPSEGLRIPRCGFSS